MLDRVRRMLQVGSTGAPPAVVVEVVTHDRITNAASLAIEAALPVAMATRLRLVRRISAPKLMADAAARFR